MCIISGENELFSMGFRHLRALHSSNHVWHLAMIANKKGTENRDLIAQWEQQLHIGNAILALSVTSYPVKLLSSKLGSQQIHPVVVTDWKAVLTFFTNVAPPNSIMANTELCSWCEFGVADKKAPWSAGPWQIQPLLSAEVFSDCCWLLWPLDIHSYIYGPMHGWAHLLSHMLHSVASSFGAMF